jgi:hypothetical protein
MRNDGSLSESCDGEEGNKEKAGVTDECGSY